ncbi:homoprotocatechuate degradation operon regulator HpaR [Vibrio sp. SCSIO 43137]|uniref:homoprotocatechuate degradation operon regulator HpaR n=1 Tax=Vibrio sp. SCSIO 43137 TaxID=3021011 RepID=UPI002307F265|nr:homoprotocatechuate degradation operon regulator HpaR [Vibrio sp. SCSIO 43137]WCE32018.1 homoprotocatechuate degradation operon regulator HpaR [Vibrio sp. SCSIO 43137]
MTKYKDSLPLQLIKARDVTLDYFRPVLSEYEVTVQQWRVMRLIHAYDEIDFTTLSKESCILSPSLTGIINRLEKQEYVCKIKSDVDQRRVNIRLTEKAQALVKVMRVDIDKQYVKLKAKFGEERYNQLSDLLEELIEIRDEL